MQTWLRALADRHEPLHLSDRICFAATSSINDASIDQIQRAVALVCRCPPGDASGHLRAARPTILVAGARTWSHLAAEVVRRVDLLKRNGGPSLEVASIVARAVADPAVAPDVGLIRRYAAVVTVLGYLRGVVGLDECRLAGSEGCLDGETAGVFAGLGVRIEPMAPFATASDSGQGLTDDSDRVGRKRSLRRT